MQMQGIARVKHPNANANANATVNANDKNILIFLNLHFCSLPTRVNRQKLIHCRIYLSLRLRWTCELARITICVYVCICIAHVNQSSDPSME